MLTKLKFLIITMGIISFVTGCVVLVSSSGHSSQDKQNVHRADAHRIMLELDLSKEINVKVKKQRFFTFMKPLIVAQNELIKQERSVVQIAKKHGLKSPRLYDLAVKYRLLNAHQIKNNPNIDYSALLERIDEVPMELVLVQSANESMWGQSRFAQQANNVFGQWCYSEGCGLVPRRRGAGETHEVERFSSVNKSIASYMLNLNTHKAYADFRQYRAQMRDSNLALDPSKLAEGLLSYSSRGHEYVKELQQMIRVNRSLIKS